MKLTNLRKDEIEEVVGESVESWESELEDREAMAVTMIDSTQSTGLFNGRWIDVVGGL